MASACRVQHTILRDHGMTALPVVLLLLVIAPPAHSQGGEGIYWHIDPGVKTCSMVIDPSLTQDQWHTFVQQAGALIDFKSLASAEPLGERHFTFGIVYTSTPVDQHDPAWINTFTHPDADCPLGDAVAMPSFRASYGVTSTMDVVGFWSTAPEANYGLAGGAVQYAFLRESGKWPAAAVSASFTSLTGVPDFDFNVFGVGVSASKRIRSLTPYLGVKQSVAVGKEMTSKVDLATENIPVTHGIFGATWSIWKLGVAAEYDVAALNTLALQIRMHF